MNPLLALEAGPWEYAAFLVLFVCLVLLLSFIIWLARLPGRVAIARREEAKGIDEQIARLSGQTGTPSARTKESTKPAGSSGKTE
ncbi:MAG: hypothetical protein JO121_00280 [Deltaproteobacteria bacterium]|nr:hypothetical protein [Deltaproteobacteria bacterium]